MRINLKHIVEEIRRSYERACHHPGASKSASRTWPHQTARKFFTDIHPNDSYDLSRGTATLRWSEQTRTIEVVNVDGSVRAPHPKRAPVVCSPTYDPPVLPRDWPSGARLEDEQRMKNCVYCSTGRPHLYCSSKESEPMSGDW